MLARAKQAIDYTQANLLVPSSLATLLAMDLLVEAEYHAQTGDAGTLARARTLTARYRA
jgi:hypothetical protein